MLKILVIDEDTISNRKFEEIIKGKPQYIMTTVSTVEKATELIAPTFNKEKKAAVPAAAPPKSESTTTPPPAANAAPKQEAPPPPPPLGPELIFIDVSKISKTTDSTLASTPAQWYADFREVLKAGGNENVPIILLSLSSDPIFIRGYLGPGVQDVFVKPVLSTVLEAALIYYSSGQKAQPRKMTPMKGVVEMYSQAVAKEISEFEMKIVTPKEVMLNEFKPIYGDFFKWSPERRVIARCTDCTDDEETKGSFIETFTFVGVPPAITKEIRVWLKSQYVAQKKSGEKE